MRKQWLNKINELMENGLFVKTMTENEIVLSNNMIIKNENYGYGENYLCVSFDGIRNKNFVPIETETLNFKTLKIYIDNLMYDLFHTGND